MDIGLLSTGINVYSTKRLVEEAQKHGHHMIEMDPANCSVKLGGRKPEIYFDAEVVTNRFDAIIPRIGTTLNRHGAALVEQFELNGVFCTASSAGIRRATNKLHTLQLMTKAGIPIPETVFSVNPDQVEAQITSLGGPPLIIKLQEGMKGLGVILAESIPSARSIIDTLYRLNTPILLQRYIGEAGGEDLRILLAGDKVVASMKRSSVPGDFRSNVHRGGQAEAVTPSREEQELALRATGALGLGVAGVDLIRSANGPLLLEVNASPGFKGIEKVTGANVAAAVFEYLEKQQVG